MAFGQSSWTDMRAVFLADAKKFREAAKLAGAEVRAHKAAKRFLQANSARIRQHEFRAKAVGATNEALRITATYLQPNPINQEASHDNR